MGTSASVPRVPPFLPPAKIAMPCRYDSRLKPTRLCPAICAGPLLALVAVLCFAPGCDFAESESTVASESPELPIIRAEVMTVEPQVWPTIVRTQGSLVADEITVVGAKVAGRVVEVNVDLGDQVHEGEPLVMLDREEFRLLVQQAEAQLSQARAAVGLRPEQSLESLDPLNAPPVREAKAVWEESRQRVERLRQLREQDAVSDAELQQGEADEAVAEARYASAENGVREKLALIAVKLAELELARQRLADAITPAPFDGSVRNRLVAPGRYVQIGEPLIEVVRTQALRFQGAIPERYAQSLRIGQDLILRIESIESPRPVRVTRMSPALNELSRSLLFEAEVDNRDEQLRSGLFVEAELVLNPRATAIVVPTSAVVRFAGVEKVWKIVDGMASEAVVQVGRESHDRVEILRGLDAGDTVLCHGDQGRVARDSRHTGCPGRHGRGDVAYTPPARPLNLAPPRVRTCKP